jgi:A118 family predicted phage portal protein
MFQKILAWIREVWSKMLNTSNVKTALRVDVAMNAAMVEALNKWTLMYQNQAPWVINDIKSMNLAATLASELARTVTLEMDLQITGSKRADYLAEQIGPVLSSLRILAEYGVAKGGLMFKPYVRDGRVIVDAVQVDQFYPVAFDANGNITACVFADQRQAGGNYYTRLEYHAMTPEGYAINNSAWRSTSRDVLGTRVSLESVPDWADLAESVVIQNVERPLFSYFKMPFANHIDTTSPLGVSMYARAVDLIEQADRQWTRFLWEFESGERALYTDTLAFGKDASNKPVLPNKKLYRTLDLNGKIDQPGLFEDWTPTLREANILAGLDAILKRIEFACGMSNGTISNPETVALTATEIKMGKQRTYATITDTQKALEGALDGLLYAMDVYATLYDLAPSGVYNTVYWWDDSIVADHDTQFNQDMQVLGNVMSKVEFRMRNYGEDEETARKMLAYLDEERTGGFFPPEVLPGNTNAAIV